MAADPTIAVIVPCHNEAIAVPTVIADLQAAMPGATVYVYDNNSTDGTAEVAAGAGAVVRSETRQGKGNVVRRAFADIDADVYVMIDGDDTYDAAAAPLLVKTLLDGPYDHVLGVREQTSDGAYRPGHEAGNRAFNRLTSGIFGAPVSDMLSGYRAFSRRFVKSFPAMSHGFEIETELTVHYMSLRLPTAEVPVGFKDRPEGSESKLSTYKDGLKILRLLARLTRQERPVLFHGLIALVLWLVALGLGIPLIVQFADSGEVRIPTAVIVTTLALIGVLVAGLGLILAAISDSRREHARLNYLRYPPPGSAA